MSMDDWVKTDRLTAETLRAAVKKVNEYHLEPEPFVLSPVGHDTVNDLLERPRGTPVTRADLAEAQQRLYDRCTPEERDILLYLAMGGQS